LYEIYCQYLWLLGLWSIIRDCMIEEYWLVKTIESNGLAFARCAMEVLDQELLNFISFWQSYICPKEAISRSTWYYIKEWTPALQHTHTDTSTQTSCHRLQSSYLKPPTVSTVKRLGALSFCGQQGLIKITNLNPWWAYKISIQDQWSMNRDQDTY